MPLPNGPGILVRVDYFGPLPTTPRGKSYILLFTDRFSRRADMYATAEAEFTASNTADTLVDRYIPLWGYPVSLLSDNGLQLCSKLSRALYERLGVNKIAASSNHPCTNGGVERVNHMMALMLTIVGDEEQKIGTYNPRTSRAPITTPSAPPPGLPPTKYTWAAFLSFPSPSSTP